MSSSSLPINTVILGDCVEVMRGCPDGCVNLIITSPPYALNLEYERGLTTERLGILMVATLSEARRLLKGDGRIILIFADRILECDPMQPRYYEWIKEAGLKFECGRVWVKPFSRLNFNHQLYKAGLPFREWETVWCLNKATPRGVANKRLAVRGVLSTVYSGGSGVDKVNHPAAYPESLIEQILDIYAFPNDIVLDPFLGSGTTAVVCKRRGIRWFGIEINKEYCDLANVRLSHTNIGGGLDGFI